MKKRILITLLLGFGLVAKSQTVNWYYTTDGIDPLWTWEYKDIYIPANVKVDSVYAGFQRPGYTDDTHDYIFSFTYGPVYNSSTAVAPWNYTTVSNSLFGYWHDLTSFNYTGEGVIRVGLPTNAGAIWDSLGIATSSTLSIDENKEQSRLRVYPNPAKELINIELIEGSSIVITNAIGQVVYKSINNETKISVDVSNFPSGIYFIHEQEGTVIKFIKE